MILVVRLQWTCQMWHVVPVNGQILSRCLDGSKQEQQQQHTYDQIVIGGCRPRQQQTAAGVVILLHICGQLLLAVATRGNSNMQHRLLISQLHLELLVLSMSSSFIVV